MSAEHADELDGSEPPEVAIPLLVESQGGRLYALGLRFCGDPEEARDLVQETFLNAFRSWPSFEGRSKASTWLYTIAARVCRAFHRRRVGEPERIESLEELLPLEGAEMAVAPREDDPLEAEMRAEARSRLEEAIAALPRDFRMPLVLKEVAGLSVHQVAAALDLEENTVKTRLHRARLRLRRALESALPRRVVPPPAFSREVCLDLLEAKQDALDHGRPFELPPELVCERCSELFATLDLTGELCQEVARGELPASLRRELLERLEREGARGGGA